MAKTKKRRRKYQDHFDFDVGVLPTRERAAHQGGLVREVRDSNEAESVRVLGYRARNECLLDVLLESGDLGRKDESLRRYDTGLMLRSLHIRTHPESLGMRYETTQKDKGEMSDMMAWNKKAYQDSLKFLGMAATPVQAVCCYDARQTEYSVVLAGLDRLADFWR